MISASPPSVSEPTPRTTDAVTAEWAAAYTQHCGAAPTAQEAVTAFSGGTLAALFDSDTAFATADAYIRRSPPDYIAASADEAQLSLPEVCAALYVSLRSGFEALPQGTPVIPTRTGNYSSVRDAAGDVEAELARLQDAGHLITWEEAQRRFPSLRSRERPDHVLALGVVIKDSDGRRKVRVIVDASRGVALDPSQGGDARSLNEQMADLDWIPPTYLPTVQQAARGMSPHSFHFKLDARDAYLQSRLAEDSVRLVGVEYGGTVYVYVSCCFGLANMPSQQQRLATMISRIVMRRWAEAGLDVGPRPGPDQFQEWPTPGSGKAQLYVYLDDWFANGLQTRADADTAYRIFIATAAELGLELQTGPRKCVPPTQEPTDFIGVVFDSTTMTLQLAPERITKMLGHLSEVSASDTITVADLQRLIGVFMFATIVFQLARPYLRFLLDLLRSAGPRPPKTQRLTFTDAARSDIRTWQQVLTACGLNGRPVVTSIRASTFRCELYTDASFESGAWWFCGRLRFWRWPADWRSRIGNFSADDAIAIGELEALALLVALRDLAPLVGGSYGRLVVHIDNLGLVDMLRKYSTRSAACLPILKEIFWLCAAYGFTIHPVHIRSEDNEAADALTRSHQMQLEELHGILRRWAASHPDATAWFPQPPARPDLFEHIERHPFQAPGAPYNGLRRTSADYAVV